MRAPDRSSEADVDGARTRGTGAEAARVRRHGNVELLAAALMAIAAVMTAWSGFQATKWSGIMAIRFSEANAARTNASIASDTANAQRTVDVTIFGEYLSALAAGEPELAGFLEDRFRDEFRVAFDAWSATEPRTNLDAPPSPFAMPEYQLAADQEATTLNEAADLRSDEARQANQRGDNYVLTTVVFASVLFFGGLSTKFSGARAQELSVAVGAALLLGGIVILATFPVEI